MEILQGHLVCFESKMFFSDVCFPVWETNQLQFNQYLQWIYQSLLSQPFTTTSILFKGDLDYNFSVPFCKCVQFIWWILGLLLYSCLPFCVSSEATGTMSGGNIMLLCEWYPPIKTTHSIDVKGQCPHIFLVCLKSLSHITEKEWLRLQYFQQCCALHNVFSQRVGTEEKNVVPAHLAEYTNIELQH